MKYQINPVVKEQMKYEPTLPAKSNGNTAQKKEWIDQYRKPSLIQEIGIKSQRQDKLGLEMMDETGSYSKSPDEAYILASDIGYDEDVFHQTLNVISNNPRRDTENTFVIGANVNYNYDQTYTTEYTKAGFKRQDLDGLTNEYTGQHHTIFYDDVTREDKETGEVVTGFLERGNFLDRI